MIRRLPTKGETRRVARRTVETLEGGGYRCCVFGGLACSIWGMDNRPVKVSDYHAYQLPLLILLARWLKRSSFGGSIRRENGTQLALMFEDAVYVCHGVCVCSRCLLLSLASLKTITLRTHHFSITLL